MISLCDRIAEFFPGSDLEAEALFTAGDAHLACGRTEKAVETLSRFLEAHTDNPLFVKAKTSVRTARLRKAQILEAREDWTGAAGGYAAYLAEFPMSPEAGEAALGEARCTLRGGDKVSAVEAYGRAASRYAGVAAAAMLEAGSICEGMKGRAEEAARIYDELSSKHPKSPQGAAVKERLERLRRKSIRLVAAGVFRTTEKPEVELTTRNVTDAVLRAHRLDLEELFLSGGGLTGVERLDLDVVKADLTLEHKVDNASPCEPITSCIKIPVDGPGAWVVRVEAEGLRARVLLLVSDISLVVKHAPGQVLAFVRHEPDGIPVQGARILASLNGRTVAEGETGADGVAEGPMRTRARKKTTVCGLAAWKGHFAPSDGRAFTGLEPTGFIDRGLIHTDRTLYRPGERVEFRAVLRRGDGSDYSPPSGDRIPVRALDPNGRAVFENDMLCGPFGTLAGGFDLVASANSGTWQVQAMIGETWTSGSFEVRAYRKPGFLLDIVSERTSLVRGETIEAVVRARSLSGIPLAGIPITWGAYQSRTRRDLAWGKPDHEAPTTFFGNPQLKGSVTLDASGEGRIEVDTSVFRVQGRLSFRILLVATAQDSTGSPVNERAIFAVGPTVYVARLSAGEGSFRPDTASAVELHTRGADAEPRSAGGEFTLERKEPWGGSVTVRKQAVETGKDGSLRIDLGLLAQGEYRARFVGMDRHGEYVVTELNFNVRLPAEEKGYSLGLLPERNTVLEGEKIRIRVKGEGLRGAGLLTVEGEKILRWRVVRLQDGKTISLIAGGDLAPNAYVKLAVPGGPSLRQGECAVRVSRKIDVSVRTDKKDYLPGEEVELRVRTTDPRGRPVTAEVSLSIVEEFLYRLEPDKTPELHGFFYYFTRKKGVSTSSSDGYEWMCEGVPVDADLLAERDRRSRKEDEHPVNLEEVPIEEAVLKDAKIGIGGGSGGAFGGRYGGRRNLRAYGGGRHTESAPPPPA
ncbi:MAG: MG2 domain-containing protein, partial [Planctomycetota bacterium]